VSGRGLHPDTLAVHLGLDVDPGTGAVTPPIHLSTTFERAADGSYPHGYVYSRTANPTRDALERALALLQGAVEAAAFASGSAAAAAVFRALPAESHVIVPRDVYHGVRRVLRELLAPAGLHVSEVDQRDLGAIEAALTDHTRLIWVETPSNPMLHVTDVAGVVALARAHGERRGEPTLVASDATWTPPTWADPVALGVDLVVHATTKYLAGHTDVLGGVVLAARPTPAFARVRAIQQLEGAVPSPFECWLTLRGMRTLPHRLRAHAANAATVAAFLIGHDAVAHVHYPGLPEHPGHQLARRQMREPGGMVSFQLALGEQAAIRVAGRMRLWRRATSLGGIESLVEHRASAEPEGSPTPRDLLRLSVGIEHHADLVDDLAQALRGATEVGR
jgi:cystathionine gamma-synthase